MQTEDPRSAFDGAKLMLFFGEELVVLRRDDKADIAFPGMLDLPGGMREGNETPEACALRETREELGLALPEGLLSWRQFYDTPRRAWLFAAHLPAGRAADIVLGDEGQGWALMHPEAFVAHAEAIAHFRERVLAYLTDMSAQPL